MLSFFCAYTGVHKSKSCVRMQLAIISITQTLNYSFHAFFFISVHKYTSLNIFYIGEKRKKSFGPTYFAMGKILSGQVVYAQKKESIQASAMRYQSTTFPSCHVYATFLSTTAFDFALNYLIYVKGICIYV
jgi:hypothetical protein